MQFAVISSVTTPEYPKSPQSSGCADITHGLAILDEPPIECLPTIVDESAMSDISDLSLDEGGEDQRVEIVSRAFQLKDQSPFRITSSTRMPPWPVDLKNRVTKMRRGSGYSQFRSSPRDCAVPYSARSVLARFARFARRIGKCPRRSKPAFGLLRLILRYRRCYWHRDNIELFQTRNCARGCQQTGLLANCRRQQCCCVK